MSGEHPGSGGRPVLLVVEMHHLGDAVMAMPFLRGAMRGYEVHVACRAPVARMLKSWMPDVGVVSGGWLRVAWRAREIRPAVAASVWADARAQWVMALSGAGIRAGYPMTAVNYHAPQWAWRKRRLLAGRVLERMGFWTPGGKLLTRPVHRTNPEQHHLTSWNTVAEALQIRPEHDTPWFPVPPCPPDAAAFCAASRDRGRQILVVHAGARLPTKSWPRDRFESLLQRLDGDPRVAVVVVYPPGEMPPRVCGRSQTTFQTPTFDALAGIISAADIFLGNDSFAAHVAAALGKPALAIFGSGNPHWFAPGGEPGNVIATSSCPHRPCIDRCVMPSPVCLESVGVETVEYRLREMLAHR